MAGKKQYTKQQAADLFKSVLLDSQEGREVLRLIQRASGYDTVCTIKPDDRRQYYHLGRASLFGEMKELLEYQPEIKDI